MSDILIKGMEMPTSCATCKLFGEYGCPFVGAVTYALTRGKRHKDCPLVPVPEHGRLGDLDKLEEKIDGIWDCNDMVFRPNDKICKIPEDCRGCKWAQTKDYIQRMVENAPTIIPESKEGE